MAKKIWAWSPSRYFDYDECPARAGYKYVQKLPGRPPGPAMERGSDIHKLCAQYVRGDLPKLPPELKLFKDDFKLDRELYQDGGVLVEDDAQLTLTKDFQPTGWFDRDAWLRTKLDLLLEDAHDCDLVIKDYKTGKKKTNDQRYPLQLEIYAMAGFHSYDGIRRVRSDLVFLDAGPPTISRTFELSELKELRTTWLRRTRRMLNDTHFAPNPGNYCRWCDYSKARGGPCKY